MDPQQQQPQMPFTQADKLHSQRLQQTLSVVRKAFDDGYIDEQAYGDLTQQVQQRLAPIMERQKQSDEQALKAQQEMQMKQHAHLQAMEQKAAEFRAEGLNRRLAYVYDPFKGRLARMLEVSPGKFEEVKFEGDKDDMPQAPPEESGDGPE